MGAWIALTKLLKSVTDVFFPSAASTKEYLLSDRYIELLNHFKPLLAEWKEKYLPKTGLNGCYYEVLFIEYQYARIFINSLGIQAIVERELLNVNPGTSGDEPRPIKLEDVDYDYIQEVISGACLTLESVTNRAMNDTLRFS
ncbi:hypothetical protein DH86_00003983, partial [Scytalidium sp. 3C]